MANYYSEAARCYMCDTTGVIVADGATAGINIKSIRVVDPTATAADEYLVQTNESTPRTFFRSVAAGANHIDQQLIEQTVYHGFRVTVPAGGQIYILIDGYTH